MTSCLRTILVSLIVLAPLAACSNLPTLPAEPSSYRLGAGDTLEIKVLGADDLKEAADQKAAMAKAKVPLLNATETAVKANTGSQAVSIFPELKNGQATAEVTLLQGTTFKKVTEKLD